MKCEQKPLDFTNNLQSDIIQCIYLFCLAIIRHVF